MHSQNLGHFDHKGCPNSSEMDCRGRDVFGFLGLLCTAMVNYLVDTYELTCFEVFLEAKVGWVLGMHGPSQMGQIG